MKNLLWISFLLLVAAQCPQSAAPDSPAPQAPLGFVWVKGGTFQMGDVMGDSEQTDETVHTVKVSGFFLAKHELTFHEYDAFCTATGRDQPSDEGWGRNQRPVINVSWYDAVEYCNWRSQQDGRSPAYQVDKSRQDPSNTGSNDRLKWVVTLNSGANGYRLPTEAEWEYAAREGGKKVRFGHGKDVIDPVDINFYAGKLNKNTYSVLGEYRQKTVPVSDLSTNALGLKNMSGNVNEWCWDWYATYPTTDQTNPKGANEGANRVLRGGSWNFFSPNSRVADRSNGTPTRHYNFLGFRLAASLP